MNFFKNTSFLCRTIILLVSCIFSVQSIFAQYGFVPSSKNAETTLQERGEVIIQFVKPQNISILNFSSILSVDKFYSDTIIAYANKNGFDAFLKYNIPYNVLQLTSLQKVNTVNLKSDDWQNHYPTYQEYVTLMYEFAEKFPEICKIQEFGRSVHGKKLLAVKISDNVAVHENEPVFLYTSTMHGDEIAGYILLLRLIDYMLVNYETSSQIKELVDNVEIWINPLANPDGTYFLSDTSVEGANRFNANYEDLNRDFPEIYSKNWSTAHYQVETKAMMDFMQEIDLQLAANFHSGAELVNYPWDATKTLHADNDWYIDISKKYADTVHTYSKQGYFTDLQNGITNGYVWYDVQGSRQDYTNAILHAREVTIELTEEKMLPENEIESLWKAHQNSLLYYISSVFTGVQGNIIDSITGMPICATIEILHHDFDSSFTFSNILTGNFYRLTLPGNYSMQISSKGYKSKIIDVSVNTNNTTVLDLQLFPNQSTVLYPNPCANSVNYFVGKSNVYCNLQFISMSGFITREYSHFVQNAGIQTIDVSQVPSGIYVVHISIDNKREQTIILQK